MGAAIAYFITFRTYGTWLPGDSRGVVNREHRTFGQAMAGRDDFRNAYAARAMRHQPVTLSPEMRATVEVAIATVCDDREWNLQALNVRTNHVHLVVTADKPPEFVLNRLKSSATSGLMAAGLATAGERVWSRHGSTRYLWNDTQVATAVDYTRNRQD